MTHKFASIVGAAGFIGLTAAAFAQHVSANGPGASDARSDNPAFQHEDKGGPSLQKNGSENDTPQRNEQKQR